MTETIVAVIFVFAVLFAAFFAGERVERERHARQHEQNIRQASRLRRSLRDDGVSERVRAKYRR